MKILLIDIDNRIPNLALHKIAKYHTDRGDTVTWNFPLMHHQADKIYVSCVFTKNRDKCLEWQGIAEIGGTGYDVHKELPPEIESVKPKINLGFTTRGCIRKCSFCVVPSKEGHIRPVNDLLDLWDGKTKYIILLDNNILALPEHFKLVCKQARDNKINLDFNQGLDHRLLTQDIIDELKTIRHKELRFAFDHPSYLPTVERAIKLLKTNRINRCLWYVLVGFNTTFRQDLERLNYLRANNQNAFVQRYETIYDNKAYILMARWANQHRMFHTKTFEQFRNGYLSQ